jgi:hypothetical protein
VNKSNVIFLAELFVSDSAVSNRLVIINENDYKIIHGDDGGECFLKAYQDNGNPYYYDCWYECLICQKDFHWNNGELVNESP